MILMVGFAILAKAGIYAALHSRVDYMCLLNSPAGRDHILPTKGCGCRLWLGLCYDASSAICVDYASNKKSS
jgi:hypothetical protein